MHANTLGTKRICPSCQSKFYDIGKDPITCPKCHWQVALADLLKQSAVGSKKSKEKAIKIPSEEASSEPLVEYDFDETEFGEDVLIENEKDSEEEDNNL